MLVELPTAGVTVPDGLETTKISVAVGLREHCLRRHLLVYFRATSVLQVTSCPELWLAASVWDITEVSPK